ncbi:hypothetical protein DFQ28_005009 [Apophysomyces sp. BC1034]|nr:hypothetical protein DFQ29_000923 [Apophysomyces sp. BC1021]KAG0194797.1 hypothetical protein DFQ28_005009 [Apophysomyces sp. BC1034]
MTDYRQCVAISSAANMQLGQTAPAAYDTPQPLQCMMDSWLMDELCHSGLLTPSCSGTAGPPTLAPDNHPQDEHTSLALFPEITKVSLPKPVQVKKIAPRPIPIVPKACTRITPYPVASYPYKGQREAKHDPDVIARKRQKNTDAARRSRLKKVMKMEALKQHLSELEDDNAKLTGRVVVLEEEKSTCKVKQQGMEDRIRTLEQQLAEARKTLVQLTQPTWKAFL